MNKTQLIDKIAANSGLTKADSKKALDATLKAVKETLKKGDKFYERLDKTGNNYNVYTLKEFGYNVLKFDVKSGEFKFTDLTTSY